MAEKTLASLGKVSLHSLGAVLFLSGGQRDLNGVVAVRLRSFDLGDGARTGLNHRDGTAAPAPSNMRVIPSLRPKIPIFSAMTASR